MCFSYNGTRDWLKIEWRDQSCMKLEVVAKTKHNKIKYAVDLSETGLISDFCPRKFIFRVFLMIIAQIRRFPSNKSN